MSNEELVAAIQAGEAERMGALWEQVAGLCCWKAKQVMTALDLRGSSCGVELDDLMQTGYRLSKGLRRCLTQKAVSFPAPAAASKTQSTSRDSIEPFDNYERI